MNIKDIAGPARGSRGARRRVTERVLAGAWWLAAGCFAAAWAAPADPARPVLKPVDVFDLQWVADPQISPDGRNIAYVRMSMDIKTDRPRGAVWLIGADGKHARPPSRSGSTKP